MKKLIVTALVCLLSFGYTSNVLAKGKKSTSVSSTSECQACDGKIDNMIVRYDGQLAAYVEMTSFKGAVLFSGEVQPGQQISLNGAINYTDKKGTLGPRVEVFVNGVEVGNFHTSCSV